MASLKLLAGVAHNLAQHAQSVTSWLHPHLGQACRLGSSHGVEINVMQGAPYPDTVPLSDALRGGINSVRGFFASLLSTHGFTSADVKDATLAFRFAGGSDDYPCAIRATIIDRRGGRH